MASTKKLTVLADSIRLKTGKTEKLTLDQMSAAISCLTAEGVETPDVRYVTSMNGDQLLYKKAVAVADDCIDVLDKGLISMPTKESTAQYDYVYDGWGAEDGGVTDTEILKNITVDKTVYATYTSIMRYYTVTYYDDDGTTVLHTEQLAYGEMPSHVPSKGELEFYKWSPTPVAVTGDASYTASWIEKVTFATSPWSVIARVCAEGRAKETFNIADTRTEDLGGKIGEVKLGIIGFDADELADGSGKAAMTIGMYTMSQQPVQKDEMSWYNSGGYRNNTNLMARINNDFASLPADLAAAIKTVNKKTVDGGNTLTTYAEKLWMFTLGEVGGSATADPLKVSDTTTKYPAANYASYAGGLTVSGGAPIGVSAYPIWISRNTERDRGNGITTLYVNASGTSYGLGTKYDWKDNNRYMRYGFCI